MDITRAYVRNRDEVKFTAAFLGMVISGIILSDVLTRAITDSPIRLTARYLFDPLGMSAAAPGAFLLGMYLTGLVLLGLDQTKRPQSVVLGIVTLIGIGAMALQGQFVQYINTGELSMIVLGVVAGILYIGIENIEQVTVVDPDDNSGSTFERKGNAQLEFRSAERLLYGLLAFVVVVAFFEAYTDYAPLLQPNLFPNVGAITSFELVEPTGGQLAIDVAAIAVGLLTTYVFLGYDAERTYFIAGPKRSGKTHAAIALHEEAVNHGYNPRNESAELLEMKSELVEGNRSWVAPTTDEVNDLSFSFTSKGLLRKNIHLEAVDYPGELLRAVISSTRYYTEPESELVKEYSGVETREQWLEQRIQESREKDYYYDRAASDGGSKPRTDGGISEDDSSVDGDTEDPFAEADEGAEQFDEATERSSDSGQSSSEGTAPTVSSTAGKAMNMVTSQIWPSFDNADTLLLVIDMERYLSDDPLEADALYNVYDKTNKEAIVLATKADLIADEFAESHGWKTAWAREPYDEFRTYLQGELSDHNMLQQLFNNVERPYPVGYQTIEPEDEDSDEYYRDIDRRTNLGSKRVEVHGYEYVLERMN